MVYPGRLVRQGNDACNLLMTCCKSDWAIMTVITAVLVLLSAAQDLWLDSVKYSVFLSRWRLWSHCSNETALINICNKAPLSQFSFIWLKSGKTKTRRILTAALLQHFSERQTTIQVESLPPSSFKCTIMCRWVVFFFYDWKKAHIISVPLNLKFPW